ncbi:MAG TPA: YfjI family protein, partial [Myxococcota bacterium]|nr:YfjI family protein [Myxococcota bacterium]
PPLDDQELITIAQSTSKFEGPLRWQLPKPLPDTSDECLSLKLEHLPKTLIPWASDITQRMQIPLEFVCGALIIAAGSVIGRKAAIKPLIHDPWLVYPNLWGFLVAPPGSMKSPAIAEALKALENLSTNASAKFEQDCEQAQAEYRKLTVEIEALKQSLRIDLSGGFVDGLAKEKAQLCELQERADNTKKVKEKRYKTNDPTIEKLALILKDNPQGILLARDELSGWLESLYKTGREGSREFYLEAWNGNSAFSIDRIGRGTVHVDALCLSIFGGIQPAKLNDYIDRHSTLAGDDGFLERFQVVFYPELSRSWQLVDKKADEHAFKVLMDAFLDLDAIELSKEKPFTLCFSVEAQEVANRWRYGLEKRLRAEQLSPLMQSYLSKYRSLMPSLALIFGLLEIGRKLREVDVVNTRRAINWCSILESHTRKILKHTMHNPLTSAQNLAQKIKKGWLKDQQSIRDLRRKYWAGLRSSEEIESAISALEELNWICIETRTGRGGTTETIRINPAVTSSGVRYE